MRDSNLYKLLRSFNAAEIRDLRRFLASPYFNARADVVQLFELLCGGDEEHHEKTAVWNLLFPDKSFNDTELRLLMSYLNRLLETYMLVSETRQDSEKRKLRLAVLYRNRGLMGQYERNIRSLEKEMESRPLRNAHYYGMMRDLYFERHETSIVHNPTDTEALRFLTRSTDLQYLSDRLRLVCLELSQKNVYRSDESASLHQYIIALAEQKTWADLPGISTYLAASRMLLSPSENVYYQAFKQKLEEAGKFLSDAEMRECYLFLVNHCIKRANGGERAFEHELLQLYRRMLDAGYLIEHGILSRFTFHNIVGAGLRCGETAWVEGFIEAYRNMLEPAYRESSWHFNLARLHYARKRYDSVLVLLQKANYNDVLLNLAAKTLLLKTWFELGEYDLLGSQLDAMRNYIRRNKVIGYHRTNYLNLIRYTERMMQLGPHNKPATLKLRQDIEAEPVLTEKEWLLACLEGK